MSLLGVQTLVVTNAAGAMNKSYKVGDIMLMKDICICPEWLETIPWLAPIWRSKFCLIELYVYKN